MRVKHFSLYDCGSMWRALTVCATLSAAVACTDDTFDGFSARPGDTVGFSVSLTESWRESRGGVSESVPDVKISKMDSHDCEKPLYLITSTTTLPDSVRAIDISPRQSRGTSIGPDRDFYPSFGLSAICYTDSWPENGGGWTTNFCHNVKMAPVGDNWKPASGDKFLWTMSGRLRFFAYAPHSSEEGSGVVHCPSDADHLGVPKIEFKVNPDVRKQIDLLTAVADCPGSAEGLTDGNVPLRFGHALTAVTVKTGGAMLAGKIRKISLSGVYGSGICASDLGGESGKRSVEWTCNGDATSFSVSFVDEANPDGKPVSPNPDKGDTNHYAKPGDYLVDGGLTFFMVPQTLPEGAQLVFEFTDELTGTDRTLTANLAGGAWLAGQKIEYAISTTGIKVIPEISLEYNEEEKLPYSGILENLKLKAYLSVTQEGEDTKYIPADLRYECVVSGVKKDGEFMGPAASADDPRATRSGYLVMPSQPVFDSEMRAKFVEKGLIGEFKGEDAPLDLSTENGRTESSNCYVINSPGHYKFPLVYGNSLDNRVAYGTGSSSDNNVWAYLKDHTDAAINDSWIKENSAVKSAGGIKDAVIVWQDSPGLVTDVKLHEGKDEFIEFKVRKETLNQGNAVIAVRDASKTILWSWHIYVTHYSWDGSADVSLTARTTGERHDLAPVNVGYCDRHDGCGERTVTLNIYATMPDGNELKIKTYEFTQEAIQASYAGDNTYYQWGRKDPMLPGIYNGDIPLELRVNKYNTVGKPESGIYMPEEFDMVNKPYYPNSAEGYNFKAGESMVLIGETIRHPYLFYMKNYRIDVTPSQESTYGFARRHWHKEAIYNAWDINRSGLASGGKFVAQNDGAVTKTIYDPSPRGYNMPPSNAFSALISLLSSAELEEWKKLHPGVTEGIPDALAAGGSKAYWSSSKSPVLYPLDTDNFTRYCPNVRRIYQDGSEGIDANKTVIGWDFNVDGKSIKFYSTGLRDMGYRHNTTDLASGWENSWPAHRTLTFVTSASVGKNSTNEYQCLIFGMDERHTLTTGLGIFVNLQSNNGYGFSVRPERLAALRK